MKDTNQGFRIFIIGAGFSVLAGLPLGSQIFEEIRTRAHKHGRSKNLNSDIEDFIEFRKKCYGETLDPDKINFEEFMSYLDIEHFLGLRGSDTWSDDGNETQILIKQYIGKIIQEKTPSLESLPKVYYEFAQRLSSRDLVITFNYDVLLERALDHINKPYRLFPFRYQEISSAYATIDSSKDEVVILKMHGSVDWFNNQSYLRSLDAMREMDIDDILPEHAIFKDIERFKACKLTDGPREQTDPLNHIYRITEVDQFYESNIPPETPFILSPSHAKIIYANLLLEFWHGLGKAGAYNLGLSIIGYSSPTHDDYIRICLFKMVNNYQNFEWGYKFLNQYFKDNIKLVDHRIGQLEMDDFKNTYNFIDQRKAEFYLNGFNDEAVDFLFSNSRMPQKP